MSRVFHPVKTKFLHVRAPFRAARAGRAESASRGVAFSPPLREAVLSLRAHSAKLVARPVDRLQGRVRAPGDKSVSHRALIFGALALGETTVRGLLEGEDVLATAAALRALGAEVTHERDGRPCGACAVSAWAAAASLPTCWNSATPAPRPACSPASSPAIPSPAS